MPPLHRLAVLGLGSPLHRLALLGLALGLAAAGCAHPTSPSTASRAHAARGAGSLGAAEDAADGPAAAPKEDPGAPAGRPTPTPKPGPHGKPSATQAEQSAFYGVMKRFGYGGGFDDMAAALNGYARRYVQGWSPDLLPGGVVPSPDDPDYEAKTDKVRRLLEASGSDMDLDHYMRKAVSFARNQFDVVYYVPRMQAGAIGSGGTLYKGSLDSAKSGSVVLLDERGFILDYQFYNSITWNLMIKVPVSFYF